MPAEVRRQARAKRELQRRQMAQSREETSLSIGPYHVYRGDELNWFVTRTGQATRYFATLPDALTWLLRVRAGDKAGRQLADVFGAVADAKAEILEAIAGLTSGARIGAAKADSMTDG
jgi:hypothetical protein